MIYIRHTYEYAHETPLRVLNEPLDNNDEYRYIYDMRCNLKV